MSTTLVEDVIFSESFRHDLNRAVTILREAGCSEIVLFGSGATRVLGEGSDIDLAVRGCPPGHFFRLLGKLENIFLSIAKYLDQLIPAGTQSHRDLLIHMEHVTLAWPRAC